MPVQLGVPEAPRTTTSPEAVLRPEEHQGDSDDACVSPPAAAMAETEHVVPHGHQPVCDTDDSVPSQAAALDTATEITGIHYLGSPKFLGY